MPRDGSGIYTYPPGTPGIPDTTIESAKYNGYIADVQQDLNLPRPIVAGGTGANNATAARDNLDAERAMATVTNYDTHVFESGSFWSAVGALGAPPSGGTASHTFGGTAIVINNDQNFIIIEVRDEQDGLTPGQKYIREKKSGVWTAWKFDGDDKVSVSGDVMTGPLFVNGGDITCNSAIASYGAMIISRATASTAHLAFQDSSGASRGSLYWDNTDNSLIANNFNGEKWIFSVLGYFFGGRGYSSRAGTTGVYGANVWNFNWSSGLQAWVDSTNIGIVTVTSDYRTKKDVVDLPGTWDTVKALRPVSYTHTDWTPVWELEARAKTAAEKGEAITPFQVGDNLERWGFIAHELQDTLIPTAATGHKDAENLIQSPNPWTVIAALTKALQEAMTRIEALEAAQVTPT